MPLNNRGLFGQPVLAYIDYRVYAGTDAFLDLTFLDHTGTLVTPSALTYEIDDLTNSLSIVPQTAVTVTGNPMTLQIPGSVLQMSHNWQGSELFQVWIKATITDSVTSTQATINQVAIIEVVAIQTPATS